MADLKFLAEEWPTISRRLDEALSIAPRERDIWLDSLHETDSIKTKLRNLLSDAVGVETDDFLGSLPKLTLGIDEKSADSGAHGAAIGALVGPYRLIRELGVGGMGAVWLAERIDGGLKRQVALKLPRMTWSRGLAERMSRERDILASLDHPNIARIYDAGSDEHDRPYLALEYVEGEPINVYCKKRAFSIRERLLLVLQVSRAVAHAHARLVVHRDLKPANILVNADGQVRLLDFGIAKLMEGELAQETQLTQQSGRALTLDYASPEQIRGEPIGTASDVYSLGIVAYELLTETKPYQLKRQSAAALEEAIASVDVRLASIASSNKIFSKDLKGDLDAILNKALKKNVAERYASVDAFAQDIERHLANLPVQAQPDAFIYRSQKFWGRNKLPVIAAVALSISLIAGLSATLWQTRVAIAQAHRAEIESDAARRAATREEAVRYQLTNLFRTSIAQTGGSPVTAKMMLDRSAQRVLKEYRQDPHLAGKVVITLSDLYAALGDVEGQLPLLEGFLAAVGPETDRESVALAQQKLALIELHRGRVERAADLLPRAEAIWASAPAQYREQRLEALFVRGHLLRSLGQLVASIEMYQIAIAERTKFSGHVHKETANLYNSLAITLAADNRTGEALDAYRTNLDIYAKLGQSDDLDALVILGNVGTLALRNGRIREAEQNLKLAFEKQRERAGDSAPVAASMGLYGAVLTALNYPDEAISILKSAVKMAENFAGPASPLAIQDRLFLTDAFIAAGKFEDARELAMQNLAFALGSIGETSLLTLRVRLSQAHIRLKSGNAIMAYREFADLAERLRKAGKPAQLSLAHALVGSGSALLAQAKPIEAINPLREAVELREKLQWQESWELAIARSRLGEALQRANTAGGVELLNKSMMTLITQLGKNHPEVLKVRRLVVKPD